MSESKTWLPRFTAGDIKIFVTESASSSMPTSYILDGINKRLEEFEATCTVERSVKHGKEAECLCTAPRVIDNRVRLNEIVKILRDPRGGLGWQNPAELADRIEREGIAE